MRGCWRPCTTGRRCCVCRWSPGPRALREEALRLPMEPQATGQHAPASLKLHNPCNAWASGSTSACFELCAQYGGAVRRLELHLVQECCCIFQALGVTNLCVCTPPLLYTIQDKACSLLQHAHVAHSPLIAAFTPSPFARRRQPPVQRPRHGVGGRAGARVAARRAAHGAVDGPPLPMSVDAAGIVSDSSIAGTDHCCCLTPL